MDVELPDGTVIEGVPEGTTQKQLLRKLFDAGHPAYEKLALQMMKDGGWGTGVPKFAYDLGGKVTDLAAQAGASPEVAGGAGFVSNVATQAIPAFLSGYKLAEAPVSLAEKPAKWLLQSAVKPTQADNASGAAERALRTMLQENIGPTASGMDKADDMARALNTQVESAISASPETVSLNAVGQRLQDPAKSAMTQVNPQGDIETVKNVWQNFKDSPLIRALMQPSGTTPNVPAVSGAPAAQDVQLPVQLAHALKKGTYRSLGGKSYGEVGSVSTEAQKALARGLREEVAAAVPGVVEPLKKEAALLNVRDVAMNRVLGEANKNPMGLAALRIGDNPLSSAGFLADRSAYLKGLLAQILYRGGQPQFAVPYATGGAALEEGLERGRGP